MSSLRFRFPLTPVVLIGATACGGGPAPRPGAGPPSATPGSCLVQTGPARARDPLRVTLVEPVDPLHAPAPLNDAERFVFRHVYEALVRVDCMGRVTPGLAAEWRTGDAGRSWTFRLRDGAVFWDGTPVRAADVVASWRPRDGGVGPLAALGTVTRASEQELTVLLAASSPTVPLAFADPALAVVKPIRESRWPMGTGRSWIAEADSGRFVARPVVPETGVGEVDLRIVASEAALADDSADVLFTRDPAAASAAPRAGRVAVPLPWDRAYGLWGAGAVALPRGFRGVLAAAVGLEAARPAERPAWWARACPASRASPPTGGGGRRPPRVVGYPAGDAVARTVAVGVAALLDSVAAPAEGRRRARATPLAEAAFARAVPSGNAMAVVVPLPARSYQQCAVSPVEPAALVPLVETRAHALMRIGAAGLALEWDGTPRLVGP